MADLRTNVMATTATALASGYTNKLAPSAQARQKDERETLRVRAEQRNSQLKDLQFQEETRDEREEVSKQELELLRQQNTQALAENAKSTAYQAFDRYTADYDPRYLNTMLEDLRRNPEGQKLFPDAIRVDRITEADTDLLRQQGIDPELVFSNPQLARDLVKVTNNKGKIELDSMTQVFRETGYDKYAKQAELKRQKEQMEIASLYRDFGYKTEPERAAHRKAIAQGAEPDTDEYNVLFTAAYDEYKRDANKTTQFRTVDEREALRRVREDRNLQPGDPGFENAYNEEFDNIVSRDRQTAGSREQDEVEVTKDRLDETAKAIGHESFFDIPVGKLPMAQRARLERDVQRVERLAKAEFDIDTNRRFGYIKQLLAVGDPIGEISDEETGIIDSFSNNVQAYLNDNIQGREASSAYAAYRNTIRHALYGSALTDREISEFNKQFGSIGQKTGPVIAQFRTALTQLRAELENLYQVNDSYVAHFRLGVDNEELNRVIGAIDQRLDFFRRKEQGLDSTIEVSDERKEELRRMMRSPQESSNED